MRNHTLFVGLFYGTQAEKPAVVCDGVLYPLGNPERLTEFGYGGLNQDGRPVLAAIDAGHYGLAPEPPKDRPHRRWCEHPCFVVPAEHLQFRPCYLPVGKLERALCEWVVTDTEGQNHVVTGETAEEALATAPLGVALDAAIPAARLRRKGERFYRAKLGLRDDETEDGYSFVEIYALASSLAHLRAMVLRHHDREAVVVEAETIPPDALFPPEYDPDKEK